MPMRTYSLNLLPDQPVLVQGNIIAGNDGARINVKECYPLDHFVTGIVRKVTWLLKPDHREAAGFLPSLLRETINQPDLARPASISVLSSRIAWPPSPKSAARSRGNSPPLLSRSSAPIPPSPACSWRPSASS
jgi:hypothetical protein